MFELESVTLALWHPGQGQATVDAWLGEGLRGTHLLVAEGAWGTLNAPEDVALRYTSAGCVCCIGQVALRVQLIRLLRELQPRHLLLLLSPSTPIERLRMQLAQGSLGFRAIKVFAGADNGS